VYIGAAANNLGGRQNGLWDEKDGFYYDALKFPDGRCFRIDVQSIAGLIPIFAIGVGDRRSIEAFIDFGERLRWFTMYRPDLLKGIADMRHLGIEDRIRLGLVDSAKLRHILEKVLDEDGLMSPYGVRSVSKYHAAHPFTLDLDGRRPVNGNRAKFQTDPHWCNLISFHEYFNGDAGEGLGASDQTGWTGVVAKHIHQYAEYALQGKPPGLTEEDGLGASRSPP
jgi:hypothetical protein